MFFGKIDRIIDVFPTTQQDQIRTQLASAILGILCQALLPRIGGGRVAAYEMLVVDPATANLIRENKLFRITSTMQTGAKKGMQLLDDNLFKLWKDGIIKKEDAILKANRPEDVVERIAKMERGLLDAAETDDWRSAF